jgi:hypothetical protein
MSTLRNASLIAIFALLYAWDVWEALGNLVGLAPFYDAVGIGDSVPWVLLWAGVIAPCVVFAGALWFWRHREGTLERVSVFLVGWAVIAGVSLSLSAIEQAWRASALHALAG